MVVCTDFEVVYMYKMTLVKWNEKRDFWDIMDKARVKGRSLQLSLGKHLTALLSQAQQKRNRQLPIPFLLFLYITCTRQYQPQ